jgi:hypothetical protein
MSDRPAIPWQNHCLAKFGYSIKRRIVLCAMVYPRAEFLAREWERQEKAELESLIRFEPMGLGN